MFQNSNSSNTGIGSNNPFARNNTTPQSNPFLTANANNNPFLSNNNSTLNTNNKPTGFNFGPSKQTTLPFGNLNSNSNNFSNNLNSNNNNNGFKIGPSNNQIQNTNNQISNTNSFTTQGTKTFPFSNTTQNQTTSSTNQSLKKDEQQNFYENKLDQQVHTINVQFNYKQLKIQDTNNQNAQTYTANFHNIRSENEQHGALSIEMMRVLDLIGTIQQQPQYSYEALAQHEYQNNKNNYIFSQKFNKQQQIGFGIQNQNTNPFNLQKQGTLGFGNLNNNNSNNNNNSGFNLNQFGSQNNNIMSQNQQNQFGGLNKNFTGFNSNTNSTTNNPFSSNQNNNNPFGQNQQKFGFNSNNAFSNNQFNLNNNNNNNNNNTGFGFNLNSQNQGSSNPFSALGSGGNKNAFSSSSNNNGGFQLNLMGNSNQQQQFSNNSFLKQPTLQQNQFNAFGNNNNNQSTSKGLNFGFGMNNNNNTQPQSNFFNLNNNNQQNNSNSTLNLQNKAFSFGTNSNNGNNMFNTFSNNSSSTNTLNNGLSFGNQFNLNSNNNINNNNGFKPFQIQPMSSNTTFGNGISNMTFGQTSNNSFGATPINNTITGGVGVQNRVPQLTLTNPALSNNATILQQPSQTVENMLTLGSSGVMLNLATGQYNNNQIHSNSSASTQASISSNAGNATLGQRPIGSIGVLNQPQQQIQLSQNQNQLDPYGQVANNQLGQAAVPSLMDDNIINPYSIPLYDQFDGVLTNEFLQSKELNKNPWDIQSKIQFNCIDHYDQPIKNYKIQFNEKSRLSRNFENQAKTSSNNFELREKISPLPQRTLYLSSNKFSELQRQKKEDENQDLTSQRKKQEKDREQIYMSEQNPNVLNNEFAQKQKELREQQKYQKFLSEKGVLMLKVTIDEEYKQEGQKNELEFGIHHTRDCEDIFKHVEEWLIKEIKLSPALHEYKLMYRNSMLKRSQTLEEAQILTNCNLYVLVKRKQQEQVKVTSNIVESEKGKKKSIETVKSDKVISGVMERLPKQPKSGYLLKPTYPELLKMSLNQLSKVENFSIENQYGKIEFLGKTDLVDVDLADLITIKQGLVEVYDDERHEKPEIGEKLNKPAIITFFHIKPKNNEDLKQTEKRLRRQIQKNGGEHIYYDKDQQTWKFKVPNF